jgi:hypothetical protein
VSKDCLASFRGFGQTVAGNALVPVDAVSGDDDQGGQESCSTMCASNAVARNSTSIERGVLHGTRIRSVPAIVLLRFAEMEPLADWFADRLADVVREKSEGAGG